MANKFDARQTISRDVLDQLAAGVADKELDDLLRATDNELTMPLRMRASATPDLVVNIDAISVTNPEHGRHRIIPPISNLHPTFISGTATFPAASGGNITFSSGDPVQLNVGVGNFIKVGLYIDPNGDLTASTGIEGASEGAATSPPSIANVFAIGYVVVENVGGVIQPIENGDIYQYVGGGGGSGSGDASSVLSRLWDTFSDSIYNQLTGIDLSSDQDNHIDVASTGSFSLVSNSFEFSAGAQTLITTQLLSQEEFVDLGLEFANAQFVVFWNEDAVDTAATYEISTDGGATYTTIIMERVGQSTESYIGNINNPYTESDLISETTTDGTEPFSTQDSFGQQFTLTDPTLLTAITMSGSLVGSPTGTISCTIQTDSAGEPDGVAIATAISTVDVTGIGGTAEDIMFSFDNDVIPAGTYWIVIEGDVTYDGSKDGSNHVLFETNSAGSGFSTETAAVWTDTTEGLVHTYTGKITDVRVRITSSTGSVNIIGYGLFYDAQAKLSYGQKLQQEFTFQSNSAPASFALNWIPDPDLLIVKLKETGQIFSHATVGDTNGFTVSGANVSFPAGAFTQDVDESFTLVFQQIHGSVDNSDDNAGKIANNTSDIALLSEGGDASNGPLLATSSVAGAVSYFDEYTLVLSNSGANNINGTIYFTRVGNTIVFTSDGNLTHTSGALVTSDAGEVPEPFRPNQTDTVYSCYHYNNQAGWNIGFNNDGSITLSYQNETAGAANTNSERPVNGSFRRI